MQPEETASKGYPAGVTSRLSDSDCLEDDSDTKNRWYWWSDGVAMCNFADSSLLPLAVLVRLEFMPNVRKENSESPSMHCWRLFARRALAVASRQLALCAARRGAASSLGASPRERQLEYVHVPRFCSALSTEQHCQVGLRPYSASRKSRHRNDIPARNKAGRSPRCIHPRISLREVGQANRVIEFDPLIIPAAR